MSHKQKYVRHSTLGVALFPADTELSHADIGYVMRHRAYAGSIISAGFVWIGNTGSVAIEGRSESLGIGPLPDDALVIEKQLGLK